MLASKIMKIIANFMDAVYFLKTEGHCRTGTVDIGCSVYTVNGLRLDFHVLSSFPR